MDFNALWQSENIIIEFGIWAIVSIAGINLCIVRSMAKSSAK